MLDEEWNVGRISWNVGRIYSTKNFIKVIVNFTPQRNQKIYKNVKFFMPHIRLLKMDSIDI